MDSPARLLLLPANSIFSGFERDENNDGTAARLWADAPSGEKAGTDDDDWKLFQSHCEALLKAGGLQPRPRSIERIAIQLVQVTNNCFRAGLRESARRSAGAARRAKQRKVDQRSRIVQRAIIAVCAKQKVTPAASEKFAVSIQAEVIEAARQFGLADAQSGTSSRSIQRHIAALLKDEGMQ